MIGTHTSVVVTEDSHPEAVFYPSLPMLALGGNAAINLADHPDPQAFLSALIMAAGDLAEAIEATS
jgi:hypothetical protein